MTKTLEERATEYIELHKSFGKIPDGLILLIEDQQARIRELEKEKTMPKPLDCTAPTGETGKIDIIDYTPTEAEVEAAAMAITRVNSPDEDPYTPTSDWFRANPANTQYSWQLNVPMAKAALEAAAKVRGK